MKPSARASRRIAALPSTRSFYESAVQRAVGRVVAGLDQALDLEELARAAALSPFHFHRVFRGMVGETPLELHRRLRLERAASRLLGTDLPVTAVAFEAGYETHEAFTRAFRASYHCAPSELRRAPPAAGAGREREFPTELAARSGIHFHPQSAVPKVPFTAGGPAMDVVIKEMPEHRIAAVRHVGPYNRIFEAFHRLGELAAGARLHSPEAALIALYHDDPETTPGPELRSDAGLVVPPRARLPEGLAELRLPAGRCACATHRGPYEELGDAWARLMGEWLPRSGHRVGDGPCYELYRNTPADVPRDELVTELYLPLADAAGGSPAR